MAKNIFTKRVLILMCILLITLYIVLISVKGSKMTQLSEADHYSGGGFMNSIASSLSSSAAKRVPGEAIMSKMGNETLKAELGRSAWRLLHTMAGKFPYEPTKDEQTALLDFIYLFARLYPCGDCARHFKLVLEKHPPDVTNRETISQWACKVHNVVNERLKKPIFDCSKVGDLWKCGCAEDEENNNSTITGPTGGKFNAGSYKNFDDTKIQQ